MAPLNPLRRSRRSLLGASVALSIALGAFACGDTTFPNALPLYNPDAEVSDLDTDAGAPASEASAGDAAQDAPTLDAAKGSDAGDAGRSDAGDGAAGDAGDSGAQDGGDASSDAHADAL